MGSTGEPRASHATHARELARTARAGAPWALALTLLLGLVGLFAYAPLFAVDLFWHLRLGRVIAETHAIPNVDLFSAVHPERPYVQFQWLWELLAYGSYLLGGLRGVRVFQVCTLLASFVAWGLASWRVLRSVALVFCFGALALVLFEDRFQARPSATLLGFVALSLPWLLDPELRDRRSSAAWIVALAALWSNIHSGESLLLVLCLGALSAGGLLEWKLGRAGPTRFRRDLTLLACAGLGVLLSPAFLAGWGDWMHAMAPQLVSGNKEWRPTYTMLEYGFTPSFVLIALAPTLVGLAYLAEQLSRARAHSSLDRARYPWSEWLLCVGLLVLAQQAVRNAFLCLVPACFMLRRLPRPLSLRSQRLLGALGAALLLVAFQDHVVEGYGGVESALEVLPEDVAPNLFPIDLAEFMREAEIEGKLFNEGRWGGFLIWELWPRCHVFVDSRQDLSAEMWPLFLAGQHAHTRPAALHRAVERWGLELAVFRGPTFPIISAPPDWELLYKAGDQELYQHRNAIHADLNRERARRWLHARAHELSIHAEDAALATEVGARIWLSAPAQQRLARHATSLRASLDASERTEGLLLDSQLAFQAGRYARTLQLLDPLLARDEDHVQALSRYALAAFALGERERARAALRRLEPHVAELSPPQLGRLAALSRTLREPSTRTPPR